MERAVRDPAEVAYRRRRAAIGSALFMAVGPGTVAGLVPFLLTRWRTQRPCLVGRRPVRRAPCSLASGAR
jgi:hypothetical protein